MRSLRHLALALVVAAGCSTSNSADAPDASGDDAGGDEKPPRDPNKNCVKPGTPNNELGVGGYCEPRTSQCVGDAGIAFCTGAFNAPDDAWFCTKPCSDDTMCGTGAYCDHDPMGSGCVPNVCGSRDAAADAPSGDSAGDSAIDANTNETGSEAGGSDASDAGAG